MQQMIDYSSQGPVGTALASARRARWGSFEGAVFLFLLCLQVPLSAQVLTPDGKLVTGTAQPATEMKNSLGVAYVAIPGTPVLFATYETRVSDYMAFVRDSGYVWNSMPDFPQSPDHPVVNISLRDAIAYCNWLTKREQDAGAISELQSYRLPTAKEWDAAAGLSSGRKVDAPAAELEEDKKKFPWGLEWPPSIQVGNLNFAEISGSDDGYTFTAPVGRFKASPEGLYDLAGNVWEWTWDRETQTDSIGTLRGGSWMYFRKECLLSSYLYEVPATLRAPSIGFRCVMEDKRRVAAFLAEARLAEGKKNAQNREGLAAAIPAEEMQRMREELLNKPGKKAGGPELPDLATLKPAVPGTDHTNSLGMVLRPVAADLPVLIGEHEVRVQDYQVAMESMKKSWDQRPSFSITGVHPVMNVSWKEAEAFCAWLTIRERVAGLIGPKDRYRLPTDAEWSRAAGLEAETGDTPEARHLGNKRDYPWGQSEVPPQRSANLDSASMNGRYQDNFSYTAPVKSFSPSPLRLYDLAGNVAEWCEDAWPSASGERVVRGSSWLTSSAEQMLVSYRRHLPEDTLRPEVGFRVVLELGKP